MKWIKNNFICLPKQDFLCTLKKLGKDIYFVKYDRNDNSFWIPELDDACHSSQVTKDEIEFIYLFPEIKFKKCNCPNELED